MSGECFTLSYDKQAALAVMKTGGERNREREREGETEREGDRKSVV